MPMLLIFLGIVGSLVLFEVEGYQENGQAVSLAEIIRFTRVRKSLPMLLLLALTAVLAGMEIYMYATGQIYKNGIGAIGFVRLGIMFLALGSLMYLKIKSPNLNQRTKTTTIAIVATLALFFVLTYLGDF